MRNVRIGVAELSDDSVKFKDVLANIVSFLNRLNSTIAVDAPKGKESSLKVQTCNIISKALIC